MVVSVVVDAAADELIVVVFDFALFRLNHSTCNQLLGLDEHVMHSLETNSCIVNTHSFYTQDRFVLEGISTEASMPANFN